MQKRPRYYREIAEILTEDRTPKYHTVFCHDNGKWSHYSDYDTADDAREAKSSLRSSQGYKGRHVLILRTPKSIKVWGGEKGVDPHQYVSGVLAAKKGINESPFSDMVWKGIHSMVAKRKERKRTEELDAYHRNTPVMQRNVNVRYHAGDGVFYGHVHGKQIQPSTPRELRVHLIQNLRYPPDDAEKIIQHHMTNSTIGSAAPAKAPTVDHHKIVYHVERYLNLHHELEHTPEHEKAKQKGVPVFKRSMILDLMRHHATEATKHGFDHTSEEHWNKYTAMIDKKNRGENYLDTK